MRIDGQAAVPTLGEPTSATVAPPLLSGHEVEANDQVVLGALTLAQLHKQVGDTVELDTGVGKPNPLRIVGTATMPTIGGGQGNQHLEMGSGALVSSHVFPQTNDNGYNLPGAAPGPEAILVRMKDPTDGAALGSLQRTAEIVNYRAMGSTPAVLGAALAAGVVAALGLTLIASVRRRRRDLALMKMLGFTHRQLAATVAWQSTVAVAIGTAVGVPLGIIVGRQLWVLFAHQIDVAPTPTVPATTILLVAVGALILANLVAVLPGRIAARTPTAVLLRAE